MDDEIRAALTGSPPKARDLLRRVLIAEQGDRDVIAAALLRFRDEAGDELADTLDLLMVHPEQRRRVVRLLGELAAREP